MSKIIKNHEIIEETWTLLKLNEGESAHTVALPEEAHLIVPFSVWQARRDVLAKRPQLGVWINGYDEPEALAEDLAYFALIAINFPIFTDGRGYSSAALLRTRYHYTGELRAIGDVLQDQLFYMKRCGFDAYALRADKNIEAALKSLTDFTEVYQTSTDQPLPLYRRYLRSSL